MKFKIDPAQCQARRDRDTQAAVRADDKQGQRQNRREPRRAAEDYLTLKDRIQGKIRPDGTPVRALPIRLGAPKTEPSKIPAPDARLAAGDYVSPCCEARYRRLKERIGL